jgi:hypothetical protein
MAVPDEHEAQRKVSARRVTFKLDKDFPPGHPLSVSLLRLMLASDDARHIQMLLLMLEGIENHSTPFDRSITNGTTLHLFRLLCGHLCEAGIAFRNLENTHQHLVDSAATGETKLKGDLTSVRQAFATTPKGAFHYSFLEPIRTNFGFHYD